MINVEPKAGARSFASGSDDSVLVAVGMFGTVRRTLDSGLNWVSTNSGTQSTLMSVIGRPHNVFVAVGYEGTIIRSTDAGQTWVPVASAVARTLNRIVGGSDGLISVGDAGTVVRSSDDGLTWTAVVSHARCSRYEPEIGSGDSITVQETRSKDCDLLAAVVGPGGVLIAVGYGGVVIRSIDGGASWSMQDSATDRNLLDVITCPDGTLLAMGDGGAIIRSNDRGVHWTRIPSGTNGALTDMIVGKNKELIAVGAEGTVIRSIDAGYHWTGASSPTTHSLMRILSASDGSMVGFGLQGTIIRSIDGGLHWHNSPQASKNDIVSAAVTESGSLVAIDELGTILRSETAGNSWVNVLTPVHDTLAALMVHTNGVLIAVGSQGSIVRSLDRGATWQRSNSGTLVDLNSVTEGPYGSVIAVGDAGTVLRSADAGVTWSQSSSVFGGRLTNVIREEGGTLVATGEDVLYSENSGIDWALARIELGSTLNDVLSLPNHILIAVGGRGTVVRSVDGGLSWHHVGGAAEAAGDETVFQSVAATNSGTVVAVGTAGRVLRSSDFGAHWEPVGIGTRTNLSRAIATSDGVLIAVGRDGIFRSENEGVTWRPASLWPGRTLDTESPQFSSYSTSSPFQGGSHLVVDDNGALLVLGDSALFRSVDKGRNWSSMAPGTSAVLRAMIAEPEGGVLAVGEGGEIVRTSPVMLPAPRILKMTSGYSTITGYPNLRITLSDESRLCRTLGCLTLDEHGQIEQHDRSGSPSLVSLPKFDTAEYEIALDPRPLGVKLGQPLFARVRLTLPGYSRTYPNAVDYWSIPNHETSPLSQPWLRFAVSSVILVLAAMLVLWKRPLWLIYLASRQEAVAVGSNFGATRLFFILLRTIFLPILVRMPHVMNAWVLTYKDVLTQDFTEAMEAASAAATASEHYPSYVALPITGPHRRSIIPSPETLAAYLTLSRPAHRSGPASRQRGRKFVQIIGPGGIGKTSLAAQIGHWLHEGRFSSDPCIAVLIADDFDDLLSVIRKILRASLDEHVPHPDFIRALIGRGRLVPLIDSVSERSSQTRSAIAELYSSVDAACVVCTSRSGFSISSGPSVIEFRPRPLDKDGLEKLIERQIRDYGAEDLFPDRSKAILADRLAHRFTTAGNQLPMTPLLIWIFVVQAIGLGRKYGLEAALSRFPQSAPAAYFKYVELLYTNKFKSPENESETKRIVKTIAPVIALLELGDDFRPKRISFDDAVGEFRNDDRFPHGVSEIVTKMIEVGLLNSTSVGGDTRIQFSLDPLAETLAAYEYARRCGRSLENWTELIQSVARHEELTDGFMLALRMNHVAYAKEFHFPQVHFPEFHMNDMES